MSVSIFDLYSIGIGPSSSHTVGPMRAAHTFFRRYYKRYQADTAKLRVKLFGSLALTGKGHRTDIACVLGALGYLPESIDPSIVDEKISEVKKTKKIQITDGASLDFDFDKDLIFNYQEELPYHANGVKFELLNENQDVLTSRDYYSVGGGFILDQEEIVSGDSIDDMSSGMSVKYPFKNWQELEQCCTNASKSIAEIMFDNELSWLGDKGKIEKQLDDLWEVMNDSIDHGISKQGYLPGGLNVPRRAYSLREKLEKNGVPLSDSSWLNVYAIAVNEENAAGGKVVTAPTNGAAGIIPSVLRHFLASSSTKLKENIRTYLLTTAAIGVLYKKGASISAAEVGCQGEVGVAGSMAAAGLCAVLGGTLQQIENAAEMAMEHNLGLTCDPIGGLVQIPCIERNAMGSVQAVNAAKLSLLGDGHHKVSLDKVILTMKQTGLDMSKKYKETALGGLAVNLPAC